MKLNKLKFVYTLYHNRQSHHHICKKKYEKKQKILSSKPTQKIEEIMWMKPFFDLSRYFNPLSRYKDSKVRLI